MEHNDQVKNLENRIAELEKKTFFFRKRLFS